MIDPIEVAARRPEEFMSKHVGIIVLLFISSLASPTVGQPAPFPRREGIPITGEVGPGLEHFDDIMRGLLQHHDIPGGSLSIAKEGRLVLARGYGWADVDERTMARPDTLFGLASVSKAMTAVTILKLVEERKLGLDDRAFRILHDLRPLPGEDVDPRTYDITIRQLLHHSGGYKQQPDRAAVARRFHEDERSLTADQMIRFWIGRPLDYTPGTEAHYSNYGFLVLGQVIERITGQPYALYVHEHTLVPMGIRRASLGTWSSHYPPGIAHRYGLRGNELPPMPPLPGASGGGWIASSVDMVRFLTALDGTRGRKFLSEPIIDAMLAPPPPPVRPRKNGTHFGLGWDTVRIMPAGVLYAKNGGLPGVRAVIGHMPGDVDWAVVFNGGSHSPDAPGEDEDAQVQLQGAIRRTNQWPEVDLFPRHP
jgi:CubicO group peptidase (beta-lactamase class C family)